jgi:hypothetical protein
MIINEYGPVGGMKIGMENWGTRMKPTHCHFVHLRFHSTWPGIKLRPSQ